MNVVLGSMFRDAESYVPRYVAQTRALRDLLEDRGDVLRVAAIENESTDSTWRLLDEFTHLFVDSVLIHVEDGCPYYPSRDLYERWRHIAWVCNHVLAEVDERDDVLLYVESDLIWDPVDMLALIDRTHEVPACSAPCYVKERGGRYYDTWGSRLNGMNLNHLAPYHPDWKPGELILMDSVASVLAVRAEIARKTRFQPEDAFVGWCRDIQNQGHHIYMDPELAVVHP